MGTALLRSMKWKYLITWTNVYYSLEEADSIMGLVECWAYGLYKRAFKLKQTEPKKTQSKNAKQRYNTKQFGAIIFGQTNSSWFALSLSLSFRLFHLIENKNFQKRMPIYLIKTFLILLITVNGIEHCANATLNGNADIGITTVLISNSFNFMRSRSLWISLHRLYLFTFTFAFSIVFRFRWLYLFSWLLCKWFFF